MPVTAPAGSALVTAAAPAPTAAGGAGAAEAIEHLRRWPTRPASRSAGISAGTTQPSADRETDVARPTTVNCGFPGALVTVTVSPIPTPKPSVLASTTIWPVRCGQWPASSVMSSTGPPGVARPASVSGGRSATGAPGEESLAVTSASANGPAAATTCGQAGGGGQLRRRGP